MEKPGRQRPGFLFGFAAVLSGMKAIFWIGDAGFFGSLVRVFKHRGISHCEIEFSDHYSGTSKPEANGITLYPLTFNPADWFVIDIPCTPEQEANAREFFVTEAGCKYDWVGLVMTQVFGITWRSRSRWFCSEACLTAIQPLFPELRRIVPCRVDPAKLAILLEQVYAARAPSAPG